MPEAKTIHPHNTIFRKVLFNSNAKTLNSKLSPHQKSAQSYEKVTKFPNISPTKYKIVPFLQNKTFLLTIFSRFFSTICSDNAHHLRQQKEAALLNLLGSLLTIGGGDKKTRKLARFKVAEEQMNTKC